MSSRKVGGLVQARSPVPSQVHITFTHEWTNDSDDVQASRRTLPPDFIDEASGAQGERGLPKVVSMLGAEFKREVWFIAVLLTVAKRWEQPRCPSADEWMKYSLFME